jgi:transposase
MMSGVTKPLPTELRRRVILKRNIGKSYRTIANELMISKSTVGRIVNHYNETGSFEKKLVDTSGIHNNNAKILETILMKLESY